MSEVAVLVGGRPEWYANLNRAIDRNGRTWLQNPEHLGPAALDHLRRATRGGRHAAVLGCEPADGLRWRYELRGAIITGPARTPRPDATAPEFDPAYDPELGGCAGPDDFCYRTWLPVVGWQAVREFAATDLLDWETKVPLGRVRAAGLALVVAPRVFPLDRHVEPVASAGDLVPGAGQAALVQRFIAARPGWLEEGLATADERDRRAFAPALLHTDILLADRGGDLVVVRTSGDDVTEADVRRVMAFYAAPLQKALRSRRLRFIFVGRAFVPAARRATTHRLLCYDLWQRAGGVHVEFRDEPR